MKPSNGTLAHRKAFMLRQALLRLGQSLLGLEERRGMMGGRVKTH